MRFETADSGEEFIIHCCEPACKTEIEREEIALIWYELNRRGEDIKGISSTVCYDCFRVIYKDVFTPEEINKLFKR